MTEDHQAWRGSCPGCAGSLEILSHGVLAPFVCELIEEPVGTETRLCHCGKCDLNIFSFRYTSSQMASLYSGYRESRYRNTRRKWEPWYSAKINDANSASSVEIADRRMFMDRLLRRSSVPDRIECAVDFGGDEGQFFPDVETARKIVIDVSNRPLAAGIERMSSLGELGDARADLVIVAHVLEHLPDPLGTLSEIRRSIASDGLLYVEVPYDGFRTSARQATNSYRRYLRILSRSKWLFVALDLGSGVWRQLCSRIPVWGIVKQSEHINYFSSRSLGSLLEKAGFRVVAEELEPRATVGRMRIGRYGIVAGPTTDAKGR